MYQLANINQAIEVAGEPASEATISNVIALLHSGLKTYGKQADGGLLQAWVLGLSAIGATVEELMAAARHYLTGEGDEFPSVPQVIRFIRDLRQSRVQQGRIDATIAEFKAEDEERRQAMRDKGIDPDDLVPADHIKNLIERLDAIPGVRPMPKAPMPSTYQEPSEEDRQEATRKRLEDQARLRATERAI